MSENNKQDQIRKLIDSTLLTGKVDSVHNLFITVASKIKEVGNEFDGAVALEYFWNLARTGLVAVPGAEIGATPSKIPRLLLTERGRKFLESHEHSPHDTNRYISGVRQRVEKLDKVVLSYLEEAVEAWKSGLNRSSAVMLGCACERLVLLLAETIADNSTLPGADKIGKALDGRVFVSPLFEEVRSTLSALKNGKKLSRESSDALDRKLSAIFDFARGLRNKSGHPTEENVSAEDAEAGLLLFPGFYEYVDKIIMELTESE